MEDKDFTKCFVFHDMDWVQDILHMSELGLWNMVTDKDMQNVMGSLVPRLMVPVALRLADIPLDRKAHDVTRGERRRLLETLKGLTIHIKGPRPIAEAIVTSGGIKVGEIDPRTMQSKKLPGLFFAGELIDVDAYTGGFNLQIAWATGRAAGAGAAAFLAGP